MSEDTSCSYNFIGTNTIINYFWLLTYTSSNVGCALMFRLTIQKIKQIKNPDNNLSYCKSSIVMLHLINLNMIEIIILNTFYCVFVFWLANCDEQYREQNAGECC